MEYYRVEESHFKNLYEYPFLSHYIDIEGLRVHYLDEGPEDSKPVLLLHGVPTWSYLYRHIIPVLSTSGFRVIVPDLIGFGKSDKPAHIKWHSLQAHVSWISKLISLLDLREITLFGQDWGSMIGLRVAVEQPDRFAGIIISNGGLPTGLEKPPLSFRIWKFFVMYSPWFPIDQIVNFGSLTKLSTEEKRAYRAPFPGSKFKAGPRTLPGKVPVTRENPDAELNRQAWISLGNWKKPFLTVFGDADPITRGLDLKFAEMIPGAIGQNHLVLHAGHFIQEDLGPELAEIIVKFIRDYRPEAKDT